MKNIKNIKLFEAGQNEPETKKEEKKVKTPFLDEFGKDLTKMASENKLEPIHGRDKEILQILLILARKTKNNPVIIGEPGVGKTAIVEGIAQMIMDDEKCPQTLQGKRIVYVDMGTLIAGASKQGEFEKRVKTLMYELENNKDIILFIDEIHMMVNPTMAIDAANMFKPALARGDMRLIGATTNNEYRNSIEKDGALERRFQKVIIEQPSVEETIAILNKIKSRYEDYHQVKYSDDSIIACVKLSGKYMPDRFYPDKAIDLLDEVGARSRVLNGIKEPEEVKVLLKKLKEIVANKNKALANQDYEGSARIRNEERETLEQISELRKNIKVDPITITPEDVAQIVAAKTGIPIEKFSQDEGERLLNMEKELSLQVIGQSEAISKVSKCIRRNRVGLKSKQKPQGVFLFLGTTGTGKTHTVKTLAKYLFGTEEAMFRVDMSEYGEKHNVARLIGSPPGYVGYGEGGQLTEKVRRKPYCIVLLDEIEKAHPDVLNVLLQVFDEGHLTDGGGRKVDFKNTIIVMTSNIGASAVRDMNKVVHVGFKTPSVVSSESPEKIEERTKKIIEAELSKKLAPEFINRIDDIIIFKSLGQENIYKIIDTEIAKVQKNAKEMGYDLTISDNCRKFLMSVGFNDEMGARPMGRAIQTYIEDPISDEILRKKIKDKIEVDYDFDKKAIKINGELVTEKFKFLKRSRLIIETKFNLFANKKSK